MNYLSPNLWWVYSDPAPNVPSWSLYGLHPSLDSDHGGLDKHETHPGPVSTYAKFSLEEMVLQKDPLKQDNNFD